MQKLTPQQSGIPGQANKQVSYIRSGFLVSADKKVEIFNFSKTDSRTAARFLTNLTEAGKIPNSMDFEGVTVGLRAVKYGDTAPVLAEIHSLKKYLASLEITLQVGSAKTPAAKIPGMAFLSPEEFVSSTGTLASGPLAVKGEVALPVEIPLSRGYDINAEIECTLSAVPTNLYAANEVWAIQIFIMGYEQNY